MARPRRLSNAALPSRRSERLRRRIGRAAFHLRTRSQSPYGEGYSRCVVLTTDPLWTDYVSAFGAGVGIVIAAAALVVARRSAADANRSATSAERTREAAETTASAGRSMLEAASEQLELARVEHERIEADRARRPAVERIELSQIESRPGEVAPAGTFRIGFKNGGDRALADAILTVLLDPGSSPELTRRWGDPTGERPDDETTERWPGVDGLPRAFDYIVRPVNAQIGVSYLLYVRIARQGRFPMRVKLFHAELAESGPWVDAAVEVESDGTTTIDDLSDHRSGGPAEGRCMDFDRPAHPSSSSG